MSDQSGTTRAQRQAALKAKSAATKARCKAWREQRKLAKAAVTK